MFLFGTLASRNMELISGLIRGKVLVWLLLIVCAAYPSDMDWPFLLKVLKVFTLRFLLAGLTLSAAFSLPGLSQRLLRGQDVSYGLYLYHAPIFNLFRHFGLFQSVLWASLAVGAALGAGILSWFAVEKRALAMKGRVFTRFRQSAPILKPVCDRS
jgi:peptidoglycan/LPS O-acetylase OafA/YrhL